MLFGVRVIFGASIPANAALALGAAVTWGGGDFSGGMGVKATGRSLGAALRVVLISHGAGLLVLLTIALLRGDRFPHGAALWWGIGAGMAGGSAVCLFYLALARGAMGASAAISGLLAAAIPAVVSAALDGAPGWRRLVGFCVAGAAIWLIAAGAEGEAEGTVWLAVLAGAGFGIYFVALKFASLGGLVWPMATGRMGSLALCSVMLAVVTLRGGAAVRVPRAAVGWALGTALLDTSGNLLFMAATRAGRLEVASVLASLYPATTILLAAWALKEAPSGRQRVGMGLAVVAVGLIALG
jgi:drug/metabolite transporter (DMT)-like permease